MEAAKAGLYPDGRSDAKGAEVEGAEWGDFVAVFLLIDEKSPRFRQILPTGARPEGVLAIPSRNLLVTSNEGDGTLSIFARDASP